MTRFAIFGVSIFCFAAIQNAAAQTTPKPRPFDLATGILVTCVPAAGIDWTGPACQRLISEVQRRATISKVPVALIDSTPDLSRKKFGPVGDFDGDKAIRMSWTFAASTSVKGRAHLSLASNMVWEPTTKDIPNVAPGQRIARNFYAGDAVFEPGVKLSAAEPYLAQMLDTFFEYGEGKH